LFSAIEITGTVIKSDCFILDEKNKEISELSFGFVYSGNIVTK
jgi:hypothetical protein